MSKYIILINLDNILREKYLESYLKEGYILIYSDDNSLAFRLGESNLDNKVELDYIRGAVSNIKRTRLKKVIILDISDEMSKVTGKPHLDNLFWKRIKNKAISSLVEWFK